MLTYCLLMLRCILKAHSGSANCLREFEPRLVLSSGVGHSCRNLRCLCGVRRGWLYPPVPCSSAVELPPLKVRSNLLTLLLQV